MSFQITTAFVQQYKANIILLSQQKGSKLRNTVRDDGEVVGEKVFFERIGVTVAVRRTQRHGDTPLANTPHSRRMATMWDYEWADLIDSQDKLRTLIEPTNTYALNGAYAIGRSFDDEIITALGGNAYGGADGSTVIALPSGQKVAAAATGLTLAKLIETKEILGLAEVDEDEMITMVITSKQLSDLLNTTEVKNADYNTVKALVKGEIDTFMGFKFVKCNRLPVDGASARLVYAYAKSGVGLHIPADIKTRIGERADKSYATQVYLSATVGASRIEDEKVVEIACVES
jgi:hypothetical protein